MEAYRTAAGEGIEELTIKRSRFIGRCYPVREEAAALEILQNLRREYWDATHNCFAYCIGPRGACARYSDDGEPGGTAGLPIMNILKARALTDILVVVTRYFGGILLGAGGLTRAYSRAAALAVDRAGMVEVCPALRYELRLPYDRYGALEALLRATSSIEETEFGADVRVLTLVEAGAATAFLKAVVEKSDGRCTPLPAGEGWLRRPLPADR